MMEGMVIDRYEDKQLATLAQLQAFAEGTTTVNFAVAAEEGYDFIARTSASAIASCSAPTRAWSCAFWNGSAVIRASSSPGWLNVAVRGVTCRERDLVCCVKTTTAWVM